MLDNERILKLEARNYQLEQQNEFLRGELKVAVKAFEHHGLQGHAWIAGQALIMVENKLDV